MKADSIAYAWNWTRKINPDAAEYLATMDHPAAIICDNLGKRYFLRDNDANPVKRLTRRLLNKNADLRQHWALKNVNLSIQPGESVALIGINGSGKSTLLKMITGITRATTGNLTVNGRVGGILELGAGFHPDLTGYENIFLQATILGVPRAEIWSRLESIKDFCELGKFLNSPVRHYSSGMFLRLAFSIAVHTDPDIFIIDEALAVGDGYFMWKCMERLEVMKDQGKTLIYVSHVPEQVESLCERAIWIHHGEIREDGPITDVVKLYHEFQFTNLLEGEPQQVRPELSALIPYSRFGTGEVTLRNVTFCDDTGTICRFFQPGKPLILKTEAIAKTAMKGIALYFILERKNQSVTFIDSSDHGQVYDLEEGVNYLQARIESLPFRSAVYMATVAIGKAGVYEQTYDAHQKIYSFTITQPGQSASKYSNGMLIMPTTITQSTAVR